MMTKRTWANISVWLALAYSAFLMLETFWWFWPSEVPHRLTMGISSTCLFAWCVLYFFLKKQKD